MISESFVSVLLPAHNAQKHLRSAVASVLRQTHEHFELLLINDGSSDATLDIANAMAAEDHRIRVISHPNMGMGRSLNDALGQAQSEWIARMDADDLMLPQRLERQLQFVHEHADLAVAASLADFIDDNGRLIGRTQPHFTSATEVADARANGQLVGFTHPTVMFRKTVIQSLGGYRGHFWPADDLDLWNRVVDAGHQVLVQNEVLLQYRIHGASVCVSDSFHTIRKAKWVRHCAAARQRGLPEPTWEQFETYERGLPTRQRFRERRHDMASSWLKASLVHLANGRYLRMTTSTLAAAAMQPSLVLSRVLPRLRRRFSHA